MRELSGTLRRSRAIFQKQTQGELSESCRQRCADSNCLLMKTQAHFQRLRENLAEPCVETGRQTRSQVLMKTQAHFQRLRENLAELCVEIGRQTRSQV